MKITIQDEDRRVEIEISSDSDIHEAIGEICSLLIAWGYYPDSVKNGILSKAEEYEDKFEVSP